MCIRDSAPWFPDRTLSRRCRQPSDPALQPVRSCLLYTSDNYPSPELLEEDIDTNRLFVYMVNGQMQAVFARKTLVLSAPMFFMAMPNIQAQNKMCIRDSLRGLQIGGAGKNG